MRREAATSDGSRMGDRSTPVRLRGPALLADRLLNKDGAFDEEERDAFGLRGLLPPRVTSIDEQIQLELEHVRRKEDDLERYIGLAALQDRNETLFHRLLHDHLVELMPIVYTPTVGRACQEFSHILRRPRGVWLTPDDEDRMPQLLRNAATPDVRLIVVTDNERILGLGDQGAGGMGIPIGKLAIYSAAGGIHPASTLPVSLDVGTDDTGLLADPLYLGHRDHRLRGAAYDRFIECFVEAVVSTFPRAVVQWEDFKGHNALQILGRFRHRLASFNDDIQGTGATVLGGVLSASRLLDLPVECLRFMVVGAGAAGIGIARMLRQALGEAGVPSGEALVMLDRDGIVHRERDLSTEKGEFAVDPALLPAELIAAASQAALADVVEAWRPHVLIGTTAVQGRFDEPTVRAMARVTPRPVIMALSNPTSSCEVLPADVMTWSDGRAIIATGSPFEPVVVQGTSRLVGQGNNAFIFPGLGLGAIVAEAREVTDGMLLAAARTLADAVTPERLRDGALYPPIDELPALARTIAMAVAFEARDSGFGRYARDEELSAAVDAARWLPAYERYTPA